MKAIAPGKLILSGEHAVVYDQPALVMAINRNAQVTITPTAGDEVAFDLADLRETGSFTLRTLSELKRRVSKDYHLFLGGELGIREVLRKPLDLFEFLFINVLDGLHLKLNHGVLVRLHSTIPIGCGLGSSAASALSVLRAMGHYFRVEFRPDWYYRFSLEAEKLQHGYPSGVDNYISLHGGAARFQRGEAQPLPLPRLPMYLVQTGTPASTTGECVAQVRRHFQTSAIWPRFGQLTAELEGALRLNQLKEVQRLVRDNHRLLCDIGVVPARVQQFIAAVETWGGAAKICGAGAVSGEAGGIVLVIATRAPTELCAQFGYQLMTIRGDPLGTRLV